MSPFVAIRSRSKMPRDPILIVTSLRYLVSRWSVVEAQSIELDRIIATIAHSSQGNDTGNIS